VKVRILTGPRGGGKTTALERAPWIAGAWGFVTPVVAGRRMLRLLPGGPLLPFQCPDPPSGCADEPDPPSGCADGEVRVGRFRLSLSTLERAARHTRSAPDGPATRIVVDEVGPLELRGEGFAPLVRDLLTRRCGVLWLVVRTESVDEVRCRFSLPPDTRVETPSSVRAEL